ncbi:Abi family protein [Lacticaseibacillus baoqingensis]|uniref:Abi family protein n=1 Tax=Lacticaseibacillus baoqingensis TaxID=2486013 RepID=A0ABW4E8C1_9LACO|nr:Abi family protein [Lacticaseibacillus baoqingensis]
MKKGKSTDALMRHIRDKHSIDVGGSSDKRALLDMGYYHGYKAYRLTSNNQKMELSEFRQVQAIYEFDSSVKSLLYPRMMRVETALKNRTIAIVSNGIDPSIDAVFQTSLNRYKEETSKKKYKERITDRLRLKNTIDELIAQRYGSSVMIQHYMHKGEGVPIWAIFELFSMAEFGSFLDVMNGNKRIELSQNVGVYDGSIDTDATFIVRHVFLLKDLRNAIAHNNIVFDCRFKKDKVRDTVTHQLESELGVSQITFETLTDYVALLVYYLRALRMPKREISRFIKEYAEAVTEFQKSVGSQDIFDLVLSTSVFNKIKKLKECL